MRARLLAGCVALAALSLSRVIAGAPVTAAGPAAEIRITSPLGRTGVAGRVRIVAQVKVPREEGCDAEHRCEEVRFFVDGAPIGSVTDGPPYAVEWTDENPFERREIVAELVSADGSMVSDTVVLPPFEVTDIAEVRSVLLEAGVFDARGRYVDGLPASAFSVAENGVDQALDLVTPESLPASIVLLVDTSQSMGRRLDFVQLAASRLAGTLRRGDRLIVAPFNERVGVTTGPTDDRATIAEAIGALRARGGTAIFDALADASRLLQDAPGRRAVVLVTDGYDEHSRVSADQVLQALSSAQVTVYVVGIGGVAGISLKGEGTLRRVATETGGRVFFPPRETDLPPVADAVASDAHSRYLITYTPADQTQDGAWRAVEVGVPAGYRVRTRAGYFAPAPPPIRPAIEFTVTDASRSFVDVTADDLEVIEDGVPQQVDTFQEAVDPVSIVMVIDASGSMKPSAAAVQEAATAFVDAVRPEDRLALITFADAPVFAHALATERQWTRDAIAQYKALGGTALYDAVWNALAHLKGTQGRRAVVVLTDGRDENDAGTAPGSVHTRAEVLDLAKTSGAAIYPIGLGTRVDRDLLETLAARSGGEAAFASEVPTLASEYRRVVESLRRRYVVSYTSSNGQRDGSWREVSIRPTREGLAVASAGGYFAPER